MEEKLFYVINQSMTTKISVKKEASLREHPLLRISFKSVR